MTDRLKAITGMIDTIPGFDDLYATWSEILDPSVPPKDALDMWRQIEDRMFDVYGYSDKAVNTLSNIACSGALQLPVELEVEVLYG